MQGFMERLAKAFALLGGIVLSMLIVLVCLSIIGRSMNSILHSDVLVSVIPSIASALLATGVGPIMGDYELVEAGMAFTIFAFLPLCQLKGAHASVDIFTKGLPPRSNRFLQMVIDAVFAAILILIAWQLFQGTLSKANSGQTTLLLQFPVWWAYALSLSGAVVAAVISVFVAIMRVVEVATGHTLIADEPEGEH